MVWAKNNEIHLTRGDSARFKVDMALFNNGRSSAYTIDPTDTLTFSVRNDKILSFSKEFIGTNIIDIEPNDTKSLAPGVYKYEVELHHGTEVYTVVAWSNLFLEKEVL